MKTIPLYNKQYTYCPDTNTLLNSEIKEIYLKHSKDRFIQFSDILPDIAMMSSNIKKLKQIIFEVTQACNLDCKYCVYSSGEYYFRRTPSQRKLTFEKARRTLDYIHALIRDREKQELVLGFYGGEPMLNFQLIRDIVSYANSIFNGWNLIFTVTTNATILSDEKIRFLIENNFKSLISLDGPKTSHDSKRTFHNGEGSFKRVLQALNQIKNIDEDYYINQVTFSIVYSKDLSLFELYRFFTENELVNQNHANVGFVTDSDTSYYNRYSYDREKIRKDWKKIFGLIVEKVKNDIELSKIETSFIIEHMTVDKALKARQFSILAGSCSFDDRLFVNADGQFHICEKMNETLPVGDYENGFDFQKMIFVMKNYVNEIKKHCLKCSIRFLCLRCYTNLAKKGEFRISSEFCKNNRYSMKHILEEIITLKHAGGLN